MKKKLICLLLALVLVLLAVSPVLAASSVTITVTNTGSSYTMLPISVPMSNSALAAGNFITASGLDVQLSGGVPCMLTDSRTLFASPISTSSTTPFYYTTGNTLAASMSIIVGNGGYVTIADNGALEPGTAFSIATNGYVDTTAGAGKNIVSKASALQVNVDPTTSGTIDSIIFNYTNLLTVGSSLYVPSGSWQTFTAPSTATLTRIQLYGTFSSTSLALYSVTGGIGGSLGSILATTEQASGGGSWVSFPLTTPYTITNGIIYAIVQYQNAGSNWYYDHTNPYAGGQVHGDAGSDYFFKLDTSPYVTISGISSGVHTVQSQLKSSIFEENIDNPTLIVNGSFEIGNPPTGWTDQYTGSAGTFVQSGAQHELGSYSGLLTNGNGAFAFIKELIPTSYCGQTVTLGAWIMCSTSNTAYLDIYTGTTDVAGSYVAGDSTWHWTTLTATLANLGLPEVQLRLAGATSSAYFDGASTVIGSTIVQTTATSFSSVVYAGSVPNTANDWVLNSSSCMSYINYYKEVVGGTEVLKYQPNAIISGITLPDLDTVDGTQNGVITFGNNPAGISTLLGALLATSSSGVAVVTTGSPNLLPDVNLNAKITGGNSGTTFPLYPLFKSLLDDYNSMRPGSTPIPMAYFWRLVAAIIAFLFGTGVLIATKNMLFGAVAYGLGLLAPTLWLGGVFDWWVPIFYIIGAVVITMLSTKWTSSSIV